FRTAQPAGRSTGDRHAHISDRRGAAGRLSCTRARRRRRQPAPERPGPKQSCLCWPEGNDHLNTLETNNWNEANQRYLMAAVGVVRVELEHHIAKFVEE